MCFIRLDISSASTLNIATLRVEFLQLIFFYLCANIRNTECWPKKNVKNKNRWNTIASQVPESLWLRLEVGHKWEIALPVLAELGPWVPKFYALAYRLIS